MGVSLRPAPGDCAQNNPKSAHLVVDDDMDEFDESTSSASSISTPIPTLREHMTRERKNHDPLVDYEVVEVMGVGSMGSVSKVKKRDNRIGGSARPGLTTSQRSIPEVMMNSMRSIPIVGAFVRTCSGRSCTPSHLSELSDRRSEQGSGFLSRRQDLLEPAGTESERSGVSMNSSSTISHAGNYQVYYALKAIHLHRVTDESYLNELRNEISILKSLDHPHIVRPIEMYEYRKQLFLVMELCSGGDLYSRDPYSEEEAARIISSILSAVAYMHDHNIIHRDLKFENIMFVNSSPKAEIKVIDFGLSKKYGPENPTLKEGVGTIYSMAPEVLKGDYTCKADLWSIGVLAFMLLSSQVPFYGKKRRDVVERIVSCKFRFKGSRWKAVSAQAKNFVAGLLQLDPDDRPDADEALKAIWLNKRFAATVRSPDIDAMDNVQATLETFSQYAELKKLALMIVAHKSTSEEIGYLRKAFQKFDKNRHGTISFPEFQEGLKGYGYAEEAMERIFRGINLDHTGKINYTEFLAATIEARGSLDEERIAEAFDLLDSDDSGYITTSNLRDILGEELPQIDVEHILEECDLTHDHRISYDVFLALWDQQQEEKRESALEHILSRRAALTLARSKSLQAWTNERDCTSGSFCLGHVNFSEEKNMSERRATIVTFGQS